MEYAIYSAGPVVEYKVEEEFAGKELVYYRVTGVDKDGRVNLACEDKLEVSVEGGAKLYALSNGDHYTDELFTSDITTKKLYDGSLQVIVRRISESNEPITVKVR